MQLSYNPTWQISGFTLLSCFKFPGGWLGQCTSTMLRQEFRCRDKLTITKGHNILEQAKGQVSRLKHVVFALGQDVYSTVRFNIEWVLNTLYMLPSSASTQLIIRLYSTLYPNNKQCDQEQLFIITCVQHSNSALNDFHFITFNVLIQTIMSLFTSNVLIHIKCPLLKNIVLNNK